MADAHPILFLDMDGVLSSHRAYIAQPHRKVPDRWVDGTACRLLDVLCRGTGALTVVSSTWRLLYSREAFAAFLDAHGFSAPLHEDWRTTELPSGRRGDEVAEWLSRHQEVSAWVALDDDHEFDDDQAHVQTTLADGLLLRHVQAAEALLRGRVRPEERVAFLASLRHQNSDGTRRHG